MNPTPPTPEQGKVLVRAMRLSLAVGVAMVAIKFGAFGMTGSTAILSDAAETVVHVFAVAFALFSLHLSLKPPDRGHPYGHAKIHYFSAGFEGGMIILAALFIFYESISRWMRGIELENLGFGVLLTAATVVVNGVLGFYLKHLGKREGSLILQANGTHVLTDCWTSLGVVVGLSLAVVTGHTFWDPLLAIFVAVNILVSGYGLLKTSFRGLMDQADPTVEARLVSILDRETTKRDLGWHKLRHRSLGDGYGIEVHLQFDANENIDDAHAIASRIEQAIRANLGPRAIVTTHLEPKKPEKDAHAPKLPPD